MTDQQLKAFTIALELTKAAAKVTMIQDPQGKYFDIYKAIHDKCDALLTPSLCYPLTDEDFTKFKDFLEEQTAKLEILVNMPKFPSGGIISPTQTDGGGGAIVK
jgi:hypothetical protein